MANMIKLHYTPPEVELSHFEYSGMLAQSYNDDNYTGYIDYEDGGLI
jgi:hypothetical protein